MYAIIFATPTLWQDCMKLIDLSSEKIFSGWRHKRESVVCNNCCQPWKVLSRLVLQCSKPAHDLIIGKLKTMLMLISLLKNSVLYGYFKFMAAFLICIKCDFSHVRNLSSGTLKLKICLVEVFCYFRK